MEKLSKISIKEDVIFSQIKSYRNSQEQLTSLIESNLSTDEELPLYLINDEWLEQWKKFTCYDEIKYNYPLNNKKKLKEIRAQKNADEILFPSITLRNLFIHNDFKTFSLEKNTINPLSNFHIINKECYQELCQNQKRDLKIKFIFEVKAGKIMNKYKDKIIILYKNENKLNLILLIFSNQNEFLNEKYQELKEIEMPEFLLNIGINPNCEKQVINISDNKITFLNKSYSKIKLEEVKSNKKIPIPAGSCWSFFVFN